MAAGSEMQTVPISSCCVAVGQLRFWVSHQSVGVGVDGGDFFLLFTTVGSLFMRSPDNNLPGTNMQSYWFQTISENAQVCCVMVFSPPFLLTEVNVRKEHQVKWSNVKISEDCNLHHACALHKSRMHLHILVSLPCTPRAVYRARQCVVLQGSTSGDSCSLRSWEPKPLFGSRPACFLLHLLRPWGSSHSGSCPRKWHCRNLAPNLSKAYSLWNLFHQLYSGRLPACTELFHCAAIFNINTIKDKRKLELTYNHMCERTGDDDFSAASQRLLYVLVSSARKSFNADLLCALPLKMLTHVSWTKRKAFAHGCGHALTYQSNEGGSEALKRSGQPPFKTFTKVLPSPESNSTRLTEHTMQNVFL